MLFLFFKKFYISKTNQEKNVQQNNSITEAVYPKKGTQRQSLKMLVPKLAHLPPHKLNISLQRSRMKSQAQPLAWNGKIELPH